MAGEGLGSGTPLLAPDAATGPHQRLRRVMMMVRLLCSSRGVESLSHPPSLSCLPVSLALSLSVLLSLSLSLLSPVMAASLGVLESSTTIDASFR